MNGRARRLAGSEELALPPWLEEHRRPGRASLSAASAQPVAGVVPTDAPPAFTPHRLTPEDDPVHVGPVCVAGVSCATGRNLLEFIDAARAPDGTVYVAYTEGCVDACAGDPDATAADSTAQHVAVAWLEGWRLP